MHIGLWLHQGYSQLRVVSLKKVNKSRGRNFIYKTQPDIMRIVLLYTIRKINNFKLTKPGLIISTLDIWLNFFYNYIIINYFFIKIVHRFPRKSSQKLTFFLRWNHMGISRKGANCFTVSPFVFLPQRFFLSEIRV